MPSKEVRAFWGFPTALCHPLCRSCEPTLLVAQVLVHTCALCVCGAGLARQGCARYWL